jgi:uncharacterized membrane protein
MAKTLNFAGLHMGRAFGIGDLMAGSPLVGGAPARVEPACNTVALHIHENTSTKRSGSGSKPGDTAPEA